MSAKGDNGLPIRYGAKLTALARDVMRLIWADNDSMSGFRLTETWIVARHYNSHWRYT